MNQNQPHDTTQGTPAAPHERRSPRRSMSYQEQPVGIPESTSITLDHDAAWGVFTTVLEAVQSWEDCDDPMDQDRARLRLIRDADALGVMTRAQRASDAPYIQTHSDDARAAEEWQQARWFARSRSREERDAPATADSTPKEA